METIIAASATKREFTLLADLGTITVPDDSLGEQLRSSFLQDCEVANFGDNSILTYHNLPYPARVLKPGESFKVRAFAQIGRDKTTTEERLAFLATQNAIHNARGMTYIIQQKHMKLPGGYRYILFHQEAVPGDKAVLIRQALALGIFGRLSLDRYSADNRWRWDEAMLCISPLE